jgi:hypothetical protein
VRERVNINIPKKLLKWHLTPIATAYCLHIIVTASEGYVRCSPPSPPTRSFVRNVCNSCKNSRPAPIVQQAERLIQMRVLGNTQLL